MGDIGSLNERRAQSSASTIVVACCAALLLAAARPAAAAPATLDPSFVGVGVGKVITAFPSGGDDNATAVAQQADRKLIVAGACNNGGHFDFCAVRYNTSGSLDSSFGASGRLTTTVIVNAENNATALIVQPDGKIVLTGYCGNGANTSFCATRHLTDGSLDATFGNNGKVVTPFAGVANAYAFAAALQPDGKIVLVGYCVIATDNTDFCAVRYNSNGSPDASFNGNGQVIRPITPGANDNAKAVLLQPDGKLVLTGYCWNGSDYDFCAARLHSNGSLDVSFSGGVVTTQMTAGGYDVATAAALQPDGKIILAGYCFNVVGYDFCALRYESTGLLDTTFGTAGKVITPLAAVNAYDIGTTIALQPDGKILVAGYCVSGSNNDFCAARYNANGQTDASFGNAGVVITPVTANRDDNASAMLVQPDGKIVIAGSCSNGSNTDFCVIRYEGGPLSYRNCTLDLDGDGRVLATTDMLIGTRVALGVTGDAALNGIVFPSTATRKTWPLIRDYLVNQCGRLLPP